MLPLGEQFNLVLLKVRTEEPVSRLAYVKIPSPVGSGGGTSIWMDIPHPAHWTYTVQSEPWSK